MEEGKEPATTVVSRSSQSRALPQRLIQLLALFLVFCFAISLFSIYMIRKTGVVTTVTSAIPILQPCILEQPKNNLDHWITPPSNLMHTMSDKELFWRASFVPQLKKYPFARVPKIAFMFLTKGPLPLAPLWERFFNGHKLLYSIYIHSLPSYEPRFPYTSVFYGRQIPSQVCSASCFLYLRSYICIYIHIHIETRFWGKTTKKWKIEEHPMTLIIIHLSGMHMCIDVTENMCVHFMHMCIPDK